MVLELCVGTLDDLFNGTIFENKPDERDALTQLSVGVQYIHSKKIVHRDIKPANVLIYNPKDRSKALLKISDFGLCKRTSEQGSYSQSGLKGTPKYMAAELFDEDCRLAAKATKASDVFALGCVFYQYLTNGNYPFGPEFKALQNIRENKIDLSGRLYTFHVIYKCK
jgi:serine/threonine protein kinase